jgi:class 3 adenylate cyclase
MSDHRLQLLKTGAHRRDGPDAVVGWQHATHVYNRPAVANLQKRNLSRPTEVRPVGRGSLKLVEIGDTVIGRMTYEPGWRWSEDVRPIVGGELCQIRHVGVVLSGNFHVEMEDGSTLDIGPDDVFEIPPGHDGWVVGDVPWVSIDTEGRRYFAKVTQASESRSLATIMFTDIVASTELVAQLGDYAWRDRLADYHELAVRMLDKHRGQEIGTTGDGIMAVFDSPARAVRCAQELAAASVDLGVAQRAGLHTGEVEHVGTDVRGLAVHVAARVAASAGSGEVVVSSTTNMLLTGSGIATTSRGVHALKGIEQPVELFLVSG